MSFMVLAPGRGRARDGRLVLAAGYAIRLEPGADVAAVTAGQVRDVGERLMAAGQWRPGDLDALLVLDAGYDLQRLSFPLTDLPVELRGFRSSA
ncbi:hypothetical protein F0344_05245 [Streptomyces finlayi]|uniref:Transposase IS701-like DDE domain-containing protein n=1 Tax=Streptomyces finlayi TaxID=67296 RepID=A0A7G7BFH1_9ACTN|nr:hypothetical protein [Streptomyces finlayi]QNE74086.1 hypothetical protein F0344_05245 [Streptomyces finlayi]